MTNIINLKVPRAQRTVIKKKENKNINTLDLYCDICVITIVLHCFTFDQHNEIRQDEESYLPETAPLKSKFSSLFLGIVFTRFRKMCKSEWYFIQHTLQVRC